MATTLSRWSHAHGRRQRHYSTFSLYTPEELRASTAAFLARLPRPEVRWADEHLLDVAGRSRNQVEADGPGSLASQAIKDQALQISAGRAGQAPRGVLAAARRSPRYAPGPSLATTFGTAPRSIRRISRAASRPCRHRP